MSAAREAVITSSDCPDGQVFVVCLNAAVLVPVMPRRVKQNRFSLAPLAEDFVRRLAKENSRLRRKVVRYGFWIVSGLLVYSLTIGSYSLPRIVRLHVQKTRLIEANRRLTAQVVDDAYIKALLKTDPAYIEYIARTKYHMVYPGETIYRYRNR